MAARTSYRIRMAVNHAADIAEAMRPISALPTIEAREAKLSWWDTPALFGQDRTFAPYVPEEQPEGPSFWSCDGDTLILAVDVIGTTRIGEDGPYVPNGQETILAVLSSLCAEPDGSIVGGFQTEHGDDWRPVVFHQGQIHLAYDPHGHLGEKERALSVQPRIIDAGRLSVRDGVIRIAAED